MSDSGDAKNTTVTSGGGVLSADTLREHEEEMKGLSTPVKNNAPSYGTLTRSPQQQQTSIPMQFKSTDTLDSVGSTVEMMRKTRQGTVLGTSINTLSSVMGAGVLALPFAMHHGSVITSIVLLLICATAAAKAVKALTYGCDMTEKYSYTECFTFVMFPTTEEEKIQELETGVPVAMDDSRRKIMTLVFELIAFLQSYGILIVFTRIIADSVGPIVENVLHIENPIIVMFASWVVPSIVFFALSCAKSMEELKWTSLLGFVTIAYIVVVVVFRFFTMNDIFSFPEHRGIRWFSVDFGAFSAISTFALAYGYHFNAPYFYKELIDRNPETMMQTIKISFPIITVSYLLTGLCGYLTFGAGVATKTGGNVVDNYSNTDSLMNVGRLGLLLHFASVYPVNSVLARRSLHRFIALIRYTFATVPETTRLVNGQRVLPGDPSTTKMRAIIAEAFFIVSTSTLIAVMVPGIGVVMELMGALFGIPSTFIVPGIIGYYVFASQYSPWLQTCENPRLERAICIGMIGSGCIMSVCGLGSTFYTYFSAAK